MTQLSAWSLLPKM